jgi:glycosyltransferase involved in cell wall biosynthesis
VSDKSAGNISRKLKVCIVTQYFPPDMGAASSRSLNIAAALTRRGHNVMVLTAFPHYPHGHIPQKYKYKLHSEEVVNDIHVNRVWVPALPTTGFSKRIIMYFSFMYASALSLFKLRGFDLYFYVSPYGASFLSLPTFVHSRLNKAVFAIDQGDPWPDVAVSMGFIHSKLIIKFLESMVQIMYKLADAVCPISAIIGKEILKHGIDERKVHVIELGVDINIFKPINKSDLSIWDKTFQNKFVVEYSGIFGPIYDFKSMLEAAKLLEEFGDIVFLVRGDGEAFAEINQLIKTLRLKNVIVKGSVNSPNQVSEYLNMADVLLIPLKKEKVLNLIYPYKVIEYLATGKPIIASTQGALEKLINETQTGMVVIPENPEALAKAVLELRNNTEKRLEIGKNALKTANSRFSFNRVGAKLESVFFEIQKK